MLHTVLLEEAVVSGGALSKVDVLVQMVFSHLLQPHQCLIPDGKE